MSTTKRRWRRSKLPEDGGEVTQAGGPDGLGKALGIAYAYLNKRERTVAEVRARLERAEVDSGDVEAAVAELLEFGYLDDARYARLFAEDKRELQRWGRDRIERALRERGVDRDPIAAALDADAEMDEVERAAELLRERFPAGPRQPRDRERAFGVLVRKGYESEVAADAVRVWRAEAA